MDGTIIKDYEFPVEMVPMQAICDGQAIDVPTKLQRAVVRTDTNQILGTHGSKYSIKTHSNVVDEVLDAVEAANLSQDWDHSVETFANGAQMRGTIRFNDLVMEPAKDDYVRFDVRYWNSYDGSWSIQIVGEGIRQWCLNGCTTADSVSKTFRKHTSGVNIKQEAGKLQTALDMFFKQKNVWQQYMSIGVSDNCVTALFEETLASYPGRYEGRINHKQMEVLVRKWDDEKQFLGSNLWAAYNTATWWASHPDAAKPQNVERQRSNQVAAMLRSSAWRALTQ